MVKFYIKHKSGGSFFHPLGGERSPKPGTHVVLSPSKHERMEWAFEIVEDHWGYIRHETSGQTIHPYGGKCSPASETQLVLSPGRHSGALFALDEVNHMIQHKGGLYVHPKGDGSNPPHSTKLVLSGSQNDAMKFLFVKPSNPSEVVLVYGEPTVSGSWKVINSIFNPLARHIDTVSYRVGKEKKEYRNSYIKFSWEASLDITTSVFEFKSNLALDVLKHEMTSNNWIEESTNTRTIDVPKGGSVVTWQYVIDMHQHGHQIIYRSKVLHDTSSFDEKPTEQDIIGHLSLESD